MERFRQLVSGKTAIVITHRFTTARHADIIHVMNHGKIIESGSHEELVALNGMYAHSWRAQTESTPPQSEPVYPSHVSISGDGDGPPF
jgi:ATP-binding cassette subfamily B protein